MNKDINQIISQFVDDELDNSDLDILLHEIKSKPILKSKINRYQVMKESLTSEKNVGVSVDFLEKINLVIDQEPHYLLPKPKVKMGSTSFWQKTSIAIAASVACVAVVMTQQSGVGLGGGEQPQQLAAVNLQIVEQPQQLAVVSLQTSDQIPRPEKIKKVEKPTQHERLKAYLQAHNDELYTHGSSYVHPLAHTASFGRD